MVRAKGRAEYLRRLGRAVRVDDMVALMVRTSSGRSKSRQSSRVNRISAKVYTNIARRLRIPRDGGAGYGKYRWPQMTRVVIMEDRRRKGEEDTINR